MGELGAMVGILIFLAGLIAFFLLLLICVYTGRCAYYLKKISQQGVHNLDK